MRLAAVLLGLSVVLQAPAMAWGQRASLPWSRPSAAVSGGAARRAATARELLVNVDDSQIAHFRDREPLGVNDAETLTRILFRLPKIGAFDTERLALPAPSFDKVVEKPEDFRVKIFRLAGRATKVERVDLLPEVSRRFDFDHYYRVEWRSTDSPHPIVIAARQVPEPWLKAESLDERAATFGLFLKVGDASGEHPQLAFAADRIAWLPERPDSKLGISADQVLLANLGMDFSRFADIRGRDNEALTSADTECFYQMLAAARAATPEQLAAGARAFELAPILQRPQDLHGQLTRVFGRVKRVTRIVIGNPELKDRFDIDHYYELDVILPLGDQEVRLARDAKDKEGPVLANGFPVVCCVLEVPESLQNVGDREDLNEDMQIDAFLFRLWSYQSQFLDEFERARQAKESGNENPDTFVRRRQPSPLFIGARALLVTTDYKPTWGFSPVVGGMLIGSIVLLGVLVWFFQRGESASAVRLRRLRDKNEGESPLAPSQATDASQASETPPSDTRAGNGHADQSEKGET